MNSDIPSISKLLFSSDEIRAGIDNIKNALGFIGNYSSVLHGVVEALQHLSSVSRMHYFSI